MSHVSEKARLLRFDFGIACRGGRGQSHLIMQRRSLEVRLTAVMKHQMHAQTGDQD